MKKILIDRCFGLALVFIITIAILTLPGNNFLFANASSSPDVSNQWYVIPANFDFYIGQLWKWSGNQHDPHNGKLLSTGSADCGPTTVSMAINYATNNQVFLRPDNARFWMNSAKKKLTTAQDIIKGLNAWSISHTELSNIQDIENAIMVDKHPVIIPIYTGNISTGGDFSSLPQGTTCSKSNNCIEIQGKLYHYSSEQNAITGAYDGQSANHWIFGVGVLDIDGVRYIDVYDPFVDDKFPSRDYYFSASNTYQYPKGRARLYKESDIQHAYSSMHNGNGNAAIPIEINNTPQNPAIVPINLLNSQYNNPKIINSVTSGNFNERIDYISDVDNPSGETLKPGEVITKTWKVLNSGDSDIVFDYSIVQISGPSVDQYSGGLAPQILQGDQNDVAVIIKTPIQPGSYSTKWQLLNENGDSIAGTLGFDFKVAGSPIVGNDQSIFLSDLSLPDGIVVSPNQSLTKTWRLKNTGSTTWGSGYKLAFKHGDQMGAPAVVDVPATPPNQTTDISVNIIGPDKSAKGYWQLRNPQGTYFGPEIWVDVTVQNPSTPPPSTGYSLTCTNCPATVEPGTTFRPVIRATIGSGQLLESRGDMLRNTDNNLYGAWPHVAVSGVVNQGQTYDFTFYADHPITAPSNSGTYQTKWQLWQNGQYVGPELTIQFQVAPGGGTNHAPNPPLIIGPDWAVFTGTGGIYLSAQANGDPDPGDTVTQYYFEIYNSHDIPNSGWISSNTWSPPGLGNWGYQWHVKVRDNHNAESGWSETRHFTVTDPTLQIYSFSSQVCRPAWNQGDSDKVCFCAHTNAGTLQLQINSATDGSENGSWNIINELGTSNYSCNLDTDSPPTLDPKGVETGQHKVRLYARGNGGWANAKTADIPLNIAANLRPNPPIPIQPQNNTYINSQDVNLQWQTTLRTTGYRFEVSSDVNFNTHLADVNLPAITTSYQLHLDSAYQNVYWRVTATGPYGTNLVSSNFHIDTIPPTTSVTTLPPVTFETNLTTNWSGSDTISGLRWYDIQVRDGNRPDSQWEDWLVNTIKTADIFEGQVGHTYYFRSRAMDAVGNWEAWPAGDGDTFSKIDPASAPQTPWWNAGYAFKRNLVILNNDSNWIPPHYPMHVLFNGATNPTAAEIYNASIAPSKGDDIRVVYNNTNELNRFVQRFGSDQIDIWFPLQGGGVGSGASDSTSFQIYYGNASPGTPPSDLNTIFLPQNDANTMGLWHFQEGNGSTVYDSSGRGHDGTFSYAGWTDGVLGRTGSFNGSNSYVEIPNSNDLNPGAITLEAWIYVNGDLGSHPMIINKDYYGLIIDNDRKIWWFINANGGGRTVVGNTQLNMNQWYHVAGTYDGNGHMKVYVNGVVDGTHDESPLSILYTNLPLRIGRLSNADPNNGQYFPGYIQNVRILNIARTDFPYARIINQPSIAAGNQQIPPISGKPDLAIQSLNVYPNPTGGELIEVVVTNQGLVSTSNGFYTDLYVNHVPTGAGDYSGSLQFWVNNPILAGATVTLTTVITDLSQLGLLISSPGEEKNGTLYGQTDSTGILTETNKSNNITQTGTNICYASPDAYENDGTPNIASTILIDQVQVHNMDRPGDQDWVKFDAVSGQTYYPHTFDLGTSSDTYLYLYDTDATTLLASNDDYNGSLASVINWTAPSSGTYYLLVKQWNPNVGGCGTSYSLSLSRPRTSINLPLIIYQGKPSAGFSCLSVTEIPQVECEALVTLYKSTNGPNWANHNGWLETNTPCSWFGIYSCNSGHVTSIDLIFNQLSGSIPLQLGALLDLHNLNLFHNQLSGGIPPELGNMTNLQGLWLRENQLIGNIPIQLGNLVNLQTLDLGVNQLSGNIPSQLGNLKNLQSLELDNNKFSGTIPSQLGDLINMTYLGVFGNQQLSGPLPHSLINIHLEYFLFTVTQLCEPGDTAFQVWLAGIPNLSRSNIICSNP